MTNIRMFRWRRALDLATKYHKKGISHVDTVLAHRARHLKAFAKSETDAKFLQIASKVRVDWSKVQAKERQERANELKKSSHKPDEKSVILKVILDTQASSASAETVDDGEPTSEAGGAVRDDENTAEEEKAKEADGALAFDQDNDLTM
eukprot:CAMPEP_0170193350 /NCGR_PEP_ID=MMETSP0040_2-20121228/56673_1 /TAXON_ID=641309 /ORGANISM="Lotharella oceanica, Strain CCMP622" /LENGTH=148 /DNA_ID=CAMNT_0010441955 /DNA_START=57 /DNA_END=503 /DNA_ORIENTATION=-